MIGVWDEVGGKYHVTSNNYSDSPADRSYWYQPSNNTYSRTGVMKPIGEIFIGECAFERRGRTLHTIYYADTVRPSALRVMNMDTLIATQQNITMGASWTGVALPADALAAGYYDLMSMAWIPPWNKYLLSVLTSAGSVWAYLDPATMICERATDLTGSVGLTARDATECKIKYFDDAGLIVHITPADQNWRVLRP